jgi:4-alpha-glucanotransferase
VRPELRRRHVLSTRLAYFERVPPARYPALALAAVTTHDLPTIGGVWSGADLADQAAAGVVPDPVEAGRLRARLASAAGVGPAATGDEVTLAVHGALARSPAALVVATLEDALRIEERVNLPGTVAPQRANWSRALPAPIDDFDADPRIASLAQALRQR